MSILRKNLSSADRKAIDDYTAIVRSLDAKDAELARLQEQVETLRKERDRWCDATRRAEAAEAELASMLKAHISRAERAEAERDRLREAIAEIQGIAMLAEGNATLSAIGRIALAALQKEPQP